MNKCSLTERKINNTKCILTIIISIIFVLLSTSFVQARTSYGYKKNQNVGFEVVNGLTEKEIEEILEESEQEKLKKEKYEEMYPVVDILYTILSIMDIVFMIIAWKKKQYRWWIISFISYILSIALDYFYLQLPYYQRKWRTGELIIQIGILFKIIGDR